MPSSPGGIRVNPNGQTAVVTFTLPNGGTPVAYSSRSGAGTISLPATVSAETTFWFQEQTTLTVSALVGTQQSATSTGTTATVDLSGGGVAGLTVAVIVQPGGSSVAPTQVSVHVPVNTADSASNAAVNAYAWQPLNPDLVAMTDGFTLLTDASPLAGHETEPNVLQVDVAGTYAWVMTFGVNLRTLDNPMDGFLGRNMPGGDLLANQVVPIPQLVTSKPNQIMSGIWLVQAGEQIQFGFGPDGDPVTTTADLSIDLHLVRIGDLPDFL